MRFRSGLADAKAKLSCLLWGAQPHSRDQTIKHADDKDEAPALLSRVPPPRLPARGAGAAPSASRSPPSASAGDKGRLRRANRRRAALSPPSRVTSSPCPDDTARLGSGGFGVVRQAFDEVVGLPAAVKTVLKMDPDSR
jgi:hypothetical protein